MVKIIAEFHAMNDDKDDDHENFTCEIIYPSAIVKNYFKIAQKLSGKTFITTAIQAMDEANKKVKEKYGFTCYGCLYYEGKLKKILERKAISRSNVLIKDIQG